MPGPSGWWRWYRTGSRKKRPGVGPGPQQHRQKTGHSGGRAGAELQIMADQNHRRPLGEEPLQQGGQFLLPLPVQPLGGLVQEQDLLAGSARPLPGRPAAALPQTDRRDDGPAAPPGRTVPRSPPPPRPPPPAAGPSALSGPTGSSRRVFFQKRVWRFWGSIAARPCLRSLPLWGPGARPASAAPWFSPFHSLPEGHGSSPVPPTGRNP